MIDMTTRLSSALFAFVMLGLLNGCSTLNRMQFAVVPPKAPYGLKTSLTDADRATVKDLLQQAASRQQLVDRTSKSMVPNTLAFYQSTDLTDPIKLVAWEQEGRILIDFMHASEELGEPLNFRQARERLKQDLQDAFGPRLRVIPAPERTSPESP